METVAFYSYKGGVGRTLLVANTAQFLAMSGRSVVALDLDLEAPGLHQKLGNHDLMARAAAGRLRGAVDELLDILQKKPSERGLIAYEKVDLPLDTKGALLVIPAGSAPSHTYWSVLEQLNNAIRTSSRDGGLPEAILELQARIKEELKPDFLLIDSRTGITELGGLATSLLADRVVCLTSTAPESVEGTKVVADALRHAPRLSSQKALALDFIVTRVVSESRDIADRIGKDLGALPTVLPHDPGIAGKEGLGWQPPPPGQSDDAWDAGMKLFRATLEWIEKSFGHEEHAKKARRRMEEVHRAWLHLTNTTQRGRGWWGHREAWPLKQVRERIRCADGGTYRQADLMVYESADYDAKPLMVIEYVEDEDREAVANWWFTHTPVQAVALLPAIREHKYEPSVRVVSRERRSGRYDLPLPHDFQALRDPADVSVDSMLKAVHRGYPQYLERIITEWIHCSASTLHGGAPWKPQIAKTIIDALAGVDEVDLARRILWAASLNPGSRTTQFSVEEEWVEDQVLADLFTPLLWRLPPEASIEVIQDSHRGRGVHGRPAGMLAIGLLAREMLGLRYDPDATFRREGQRILARSGPSCEPDLETDFDRGLFGLVSAFKHTEISFELSSELPDIFTVRTDGNNSVNVSTNIDTVLSKGIAKRDLLTTGLLGDYQAEVGSVVLYSRPIACCAEKLALQPRHVGSVTLIHETLHALMHLGRDLDGRMWTEFALPDPKSPLFEPSWFHETLTQYFTYQHLRRLGDAALMHAFETMSDKQAPPYRAWRRLKDLPIEDARNWFMSVRRGVAGIPPSAAMLLSVIPNAD
jgi:MinD-like ATPase involved in chromosome partitioning or flagellar assembly